VWPVGADGCLTVALPVTSARWADHLALGLRPQPPIREPAPRASSHKRKVKTCAVRVAEGCCCSRRAHSLCCLPSWGRLAWLPRLRPLVPLRRAIRPPSGTTSTSSIACRTAIIDEDPAVGTEQPAPGDLPASRVIGACEASRVMQVPPVRPEPMAFRGPPVRQGSRVRREPTVRREPRVRPGPTVRRVRPELQVRPGPTVRRETPALPDRTASWAHRGSKASRVRRACKASRVA
jgi:hypothetical protein